MTTVFLSLSFQKRMSRTVKWAIHLGLFQYKRGHSFLERKWHKMLIIIHWQTFLYLGFEIFDPTMSDAPVFEELSLPKQFTKNLIWSRICILCKDQKDNHLFQFHCILSAHKNKHQNEFALSVDFFVDVNHFHFSERRSVRDKQNIETTNESQKTNNPAFSSIFTSQIQLWSEKKSTKMKEFYSIQVIVLTQVNDITWWLRGDQYYEELFRPISPSSIFCCKSENSVSLEILEVPSFWPFPGNA